MRFERMSLVQTSPQKQAVGRILSTIHQNSRAVSLPVKNERLNVERNFLKNGKGIIARDEPGSFTIARI